MELYSSPRDDTLAEIIAEVESATESITFAIFYLTADALRDALIDRAQAGVDVRGVWDLLGASNPASDDESLCAAGIPIKVETFAGKMHNKFMVDLDQARKASPLHLRFMKYKIIIIGVG